MPGKHDHTRIDHWTGIRLEPKAIESGIKNFVYSPGTKFRPTITRAGITIGDLIILMWCLGIDLPNSIPPRDSSRYDPCAEETSNDF